MCVCVFPYINFFMNTLHLPIFVCVPDEAVGTGWLAGLQLLYASGVTSYSRKCKQTPQHILPSMAYLRRRVVQIEIWGLVPTHQARCGTFWLVALADPQDVVPSV